MIGESVAGEPRTSEPTPEEQSSERRSERLFAAFMRGAESGMIEARGYGLTPDERRDAERTAYELYIGA